MRLLHILLALAGALLLGVWLAGPFSADPGYILIRFHGWAVETTAVALLAALLLIYLAWRIIFWLLRQPGKAVTHVIEKREQARFEKGLLALTEGRWHKAEKLLSRSAQDSQLPTVHYLAAARAAQARDADAEREEYLTRAQGESSHAGFAVDLTRAELALADDDPALACPLLKALHEQRPRNAHVLQLLARCYQKLEDFDQLRALVPALLRANVVDKSEGENLRHRAIQGCLRQASDYQSLWNVWSSVERRFKHEPALVHAYAQRALEFGQDAEIETLLRKHLKHHWDERLVLLYGKVQGAEAKTQLKTAEGWLKAHPEDAALLLTLGRICARAELWGKAKEHYQRALGLQASEDAYRELGYLFDQQGNTQSAMACYRNVLHLQQGEPVEPVAFD